MLGAQAPGAQVKSFWFAVNAYRSRVNIRYPATVGTALGVADIMTE